MSDWEHFNEGEKMTSLPCPERLLLKPHEAAASLSLSERTLWKYTAPRGPIPCCRIGSSIRYRVEDLRAYIAAASKGGVR